MSEDLRERPPRYLNLFTQIQVLFGGFYMQMGLILFWFSLIFMLVFVGQSNVMYWFQFDGEWTKAKGIVQAIEETNNSVNEESIYEYTFSYNFNGQSYQGVSYSPWNNSLSEGKEVLVEFKFVNPNRSRIYQTNEAIFPGWISFLLLFPLGGIFLIASGGIQNFRALQLLKNGAFTRGKMLSYEATNAEINDQTVYKYEFEFEANYRTYIATCETHLTDRVEDEELEKILYQKDNPTYNVVYDAITSMPAINQFGKIEQVGIFALVYLISTVLGVVVNGIVYLGIYG